MVIALISDKMRPGMVLFSVVVLFLCVGILSPKEMLEGFSNKGMITVAMLVLGKRGYTPVRSLGAGNQKTLAARENNRFQGAASYVALDCLHFGFLEQYPGGGYLCSRSLSAGPTRFICLLPNS